MRAVTAAAAVVAAVAAGDGDEGDLLSDLGSFGVVVAAAAGVGVEMTRVLADN